jgi:hypothetical protein
MSNENLEPSLIDAFLWDSGMADEQTFWEDVPAALMRSKSSPVPAEPRRYDLCCRVCGYGIVVAGRPPECPMCRSDDWGRAPKPLRRAS